MIPVNCHRYNGFSDELNVSNFRIVLSWIVLKKDAAITLERTVPMCETQSLQSTEDVILRRHL